jgi:hypothetical protein
MQCKNKNEEKRKRGKGSVTNEEREEDGKA